MTVAELIKLLEEYPPDTPVQIPNTPFPWGMREVHSVRSYNYMFREQRVIHIA